MEEELKKEIAALKNENEELKKENEKLKKLLKRNGRIKDSDWMMSRRETFIELYNGGAPKYYILEKMKISARTYSRLLQYAKSKNRLEE